MLLLELTVLAAEEPVSALRATLFDRSKNPFPSKFLTPLCSIELLLELPMMNAERGTASPEEQAGRPGS